MKMEEILKIEGCEFHPKGSDMCWLCAKNQLAREKAFAQGHPQPPSHGLARDGREANMTQGYQPFGPEWEIEMMKFDKRSLIEMYHRKCQKSLAGKKQKYRHYKGGIYTMICDATLEWCPEDAGSHVIIYEGEDGRRWVRPRHEFFGTTIDGERRFKKIEEV